MNITNIRHDKHMTRQTIGTTNAKQDIHKVKQEL